MVLHKIRPRGSVRGYTWPNQLTPLEINRFSLFFPPPPNVYLFRLPLGKESRGVRCTSLRRNKAGNLKIAPLSPRVDLHFCLIVWARSHDKQKHSVLMIYVSKQGSYDPKPKIPDDSDWDSALIISNYKSVSTLHARFWKIFNFGSFQISLRSLLLAYLSAKFGSNKREFSN